MKQAFSKPVRWLLYGSLTFAVLIVAIPFGLSTALETNWGKEKAASLLSGALNRNVRIDGVIELKLGLTSEIAISNFVIENPPGLSSEEMLRVSNAKLRVPTWPTLIGSILIDELSSSGVHLHVANTSPDRLNWEFGKTSADTPNETESEFRLPTIKKVSVRDVSVALDLGENPREIILKDIDARNINGEGQGTVSSHLSVDGVDFELKGSASPIDHFMAGNSLDYEFALHHTHNSLSAKGSVARKGKSSSLVHIKAADPSHLSDLIGSLPPHIRDVSFRSSLESNKEAHSHTLSFSDIEFSMSGEAVKGHVALTLKPSHDIDIETKLHSDKHTLLITGNYHPLRSISLDINASGISLAELPWLSGLELPDLKDYELQSKLLAEVGKKQKVELSDFRFTADGNDLSGKLIVTNAPVKVLATLTSNKLDLTKLRRADDPEPKKEAIEKQESTRLPFELLKELEATISVNAKQLKTMAGMDITNTSFNVNVQDGRLSIPDLSAEAFDGKLSGKIIGEDKKISWKLEAEKLDAAQITKLAGASFLQGNLDASFDIAARGDRVDELLKNLSGTISVNSENTSVKNNLLETVSSNLAELLSPILSGDGQAKSECFLFNFKMKDGVARSKEQVFKLGDVFIFAKGELNLPEDSIGYNFHVNSSNPALASLIPPFRAFGSLSSPTFVPSVTGSLASIADTGEGAINSVTGLVTGTASLVLGDEKKELSGLEICQAAYDAEQKMLSSMVGQLLDGDDSDNRMHPSWDTDADGINDCEKDGSCDHTVDYSKPRGG